MLRKFNQTMNPSLFDLNKGPLTGTNLIEASAGTGKTYAIAGLFVRLIIERGLSADQILVVTFTVAATEELRDRVRKRLREAHDALLTGGCETDEFLDYLAKNTLDKIEAARRVEAEIYRFDEAAIFTIHGFCQRALRENAFESGIPFDRELATNQDAYLKEVADDFWRRRFFAGEPPAVCAALSAGLGPDILAELLAERVRHPLMEVLPEISEAEAEGLMVDFLSLHARARTAWPKAKDEISPLLLDKSNGLSKSEKAYKKEVVEELLDALDLALSDNPNPEAFNAFKKFSTAQLNDPDSRLKKGEIPEHPFFDLCEEITGTAEALVLAIKVRFLAHAEPALAGKKAAANVQGFGDLLTRLHSALKGPSGPAFAQTLRTKYKAALIDEFQDTDPLQYEIFEAVFASGTAEAGGSESEPIGSKNANAPLFLIGDPKQAIYGFRGADVFAYLGAADGAEKIYTLGKNFRSEPSLLKAVNKIFSSATDPFILEQIGFPLVSSPEGKKWERLEIDEDRSAPFSLWFARRTEENIHQNRISKKWAADELPGIIANEIANLLNKAAQGKARLGNRPLAPGDIAVLVRKNKHANLMQQALRELSIPSVLYSAENLLFTHETAEMARILIAIAEPGNDRAIAAAATTDALGVMGADFYKLREDETGWELWIQRFRGYRELWDRRGFLPMFRRMLSELHVRERLLEFSNGERRLTNFLHLSEILHQAAVDEKLGIAGLLKWLAQKRGDAESKAEEYELRLESDEKAVKLVTIHRSKGLEFPVVFCPFSWEGKDAGDKKGKQKWISAHVEVSCQTGKTGKKSGPMALDLGSPDLAAHIARANLETLAEDARLLYVALTRAKSKCCLVWGAFNSSNVSAMAYLLHKPQKETDASAPGSSSPYDAFKATKARMADLTDEDMLEDLKSLEEAGVLEVAELPQVSLVPKPQEMRCSPKKESTFHPASGSEARRFTASIDQSWRLSSFTALTSGASHAASARGINLDAARDTMDPDVSGAAPISTKPSDENREKIAEAQGIFAFPKGAKAGTCIHDILENLDFAGKTDQSADEVISGKLKAHGFDPTWTEAVAKCLDKVLAAPMLADRPDFKLSKIKKEDRLPEVEFIFPLRGDKGKNEPLSPGGLAAIFRKHEKSGVPALVDFPERLGRLEFAPVRGYMRGFMDLVFRFENRYYLADWKTNHLGDRAEDYNPQALAAAMADSYYILQYHLYAVALHLHLASKLADYDYDEHFGGVQYIFLRGVDPEKGVDFGIYFDRPSRELVEDLARYLVGGNVGL